MTARTIDEGKQRAERFAKDFGHVLSEWKREDPPDTLIS